MRAILLTTTLLTALLLATALPLVAAEAESPAQRTFVVHCYDVGARTLEDRPGIIAVKRGWRGFKEINTVTYDPSRVTVPQIEGWLKDADTYVRTLPAENAKGD